jgi:hypothetical protein
MAIVANPFLQLVPFRGPHSVLTEIRMACLAAMFLTAGCYRLLVWRSIRLDLGSREIEFRYGLWFHFRVVRHRFDEFDSIEVAFNARTQRRAPYRLFLRTVGRRRKIELDGYCDAVTAKALAAQLSDLTGLPIGEQDA